MSAFGRLKPLDRKLKEAVLEKLRDNAMAKTELHDISGEHLPKLKLSSMEHPQLETLQFYGDRSLSEESTSDFIPQPSSTFHAEDQRSLGKRELVTLDKIFETFNWGQISFVGQAGSGKTTLLKSITREIIDGKYAKFESNGLVHFVRLPNFPRDASVTPAKLLFSDVTPELSAYEMDVAFQYARNNPRKVVLIIDSLDSIPYGVDGVYTRVSPESLSKPEAILYHILAGNLLPGCRIITSSREYAIRNYKGKVQASQIIALSGFNEESKRNIIIGYVGKELGEKLIAKLKRKPILDLLCANPLWLVLTVMALNSKTSLDPNTMTGVMVTALQSMTRSKHSHQQLDPEITKLLAEMAFSGTMDRRVHFSCNELPIGLTVSKVKDIMITTPSGMYQRLILGNSVLMFIHQSFQELFTAFHTINMELESFKKFVFWRRKHRGKIHGARYIIVRRFLNGITLNPKVFEGAREFLGEIENINEKRMFLKKTLSEQLEDDYDVEDGDRIELFTSLSEGGDGVGDILREKVNNFAFANVSISPSQAYSIGWIMSLQTFIQELVFLGCNLDTSSLSALHHALKRSPVKLNIFSVDRDDLGPSCMEQVAMLCKQCRVCILLLEKCRLRSEALEAYLKFSIGVKLDELDVSFHTFGPDEMEKIAKISKECKTDKLIMRNVTFLVGSLESFLSHSLDHKLGTLDVSHQEFSPNEIEMIVKICKKWKTDRLIMQHAKFLAGALQSFLLHSLGHKFLMLDIRASKVQDSDRKILARALKQCGVENMGIWESEALQNIDVGVFNISPADTFKVDRLLYSSWQGSEERLQGYFPFFLEIDLTNTSIDKSEVETLQTLLDTNATKNLKIIFKDRSTMPHQEKVLSSKNSVEDADLPSSSVPVATRRQTPETARELRLSTRRIMLFETSQFVKYLDLQLYPTIEPYQPNTLPAFFARARLSVMESTIFGYGIG